MYKKNEKKVKIEELIEKGYKKLPKTRNIFFSEEEKVIIFFKTQVNISNKYEENCINMIEYSYLNVAYSGFSFFLYIEKKSNMNQVKSNLELFKISFTGKFGVRSYKEDFYKNVNRYYINKESLGSELIDSKPRNHSYYNPKIHLAA